MSDSVSENPVLCRRYVCWGDAAADVARVLAARGVIDPVRVQDTTWDALCATLSDSEADLVSLVTEELFVPQSDGSHLLCSHPAPSTVIDLVVILHAHRLDTTYAPARRAVPTLEQDELPFD